MGYLAGCLNAHAYTHDAVRNIINLESYLFVDESRGCIFMNSSAVTMVSQNLHCIIQPSWFICRGEREEHPLVETANTAKVCEMCVQALSRVNHKPQIMNKQENRILFAFTLHFHCKLDESKPEPSTCSNLAQPVRYWQARVRYQPSIASPLDFRVPRVSR